MAFSRNGKGIISSDRLFHVRAKEPFDDTNQPINMPYNKSSKVAHISQHIVVGDLCAFQEASNDIKIR